MMILIFQFLLSITILFLAVGLSLHATNKTERELLEEMNLQLRIRELTKVKFNDGSKTP